MTKRCLLLVFLFICLHKAVGRDGVIERGFAARYHLLDSTRLQFSRAAAGTPNDFKNEIDALDKMERDAIENGDNELGGVVGLFKIKLRLRAKEITNADAESALLRYVNSAQKRNLRCLEAYALQELGEFYSSSERQNHAFENFLAAYSIYAEIPVAEFPPKQDCLFSLGSTYYRFGDNENALRYLKEATKVQNFSLAKSYTVYNSIGSCYRNMARYDSAEWYFRAIYDTAVSRKDTVWPGIVMGNIGITYYYEKKFTEAIPLLEKDIELSLAHHVVRNAVGSMFILGSLYYEQKEFEKAEQKLLNALYYSHERKFWSDYALAEKLYTQIFRIYKAKNQPGLAMLYADSSLVAKDSNNARNNALKFAKSQEKMDLIQRGLSEKQLQNQKRVNLFLGLVSVLLFIIGVLAYLNQRMTARLNKQITSQKREVEQLNDVKDRIFSVISHDMRTPVNSLIAFTELLERGNISEEKMAAYAAALKNNLGYTARLMENLLNWARTQMQGYKPVFEVFDISETIEQVTELLHHEASKKGVAICNEAKASLLVYADLNMTSLLIRNLLSNAVKYTPKGGRVIISSKAGNDFVEVCVKDSGVGIAPHFVDAFNSGSSGQPIESMPGTNQEKGTGIGLMLCKTFVALMHGKISVESEPGKGSNFKFELPVK